MKGKYLIFGILIIFLLTSFASASTTIEITPDMDARLYSYTANPGWPFDTIRSATNVSWGDNTSSISFVQILAGNTTNKYLRVFRLEYLFNITKANIPVGAPITGLRFSVYARSSGQYSNLGWLEYGITGCYPTTNGSLSVYNDYQRAGNTSYSTFDTITPNTRNNWTLNSAALNNISYNGWFNIMLRSDADALNDESKLTWVSGANSTFSVYMSEQGTVYMPVLRITYDDPAPPGDLVASFTPTLLTRPTVYGTSNVTFTSTSTGSPTLYDWRISDVTGNNTLIHLNNNTATPFKRFPVGNWSVTLNVSNSIEFNITPANSHFVNVSQWSQDGRDTLPLLPANHIYRQDITLLPVDPRSTAWVNAIGTEFPGVYLKYYMNYPIMYIGADAPTGTFTFDRVFGDRISDTTIQYPIIEDWDYETTSSDGKMAAIDRDNRRVYEWSYVWDTDHPYIYNLTTGVPTAGGGLGYDLQNLSIHWPLGKTGVIISAMQQVPLELTKADIASSSPINHALSFGLSDPGGTSTATSFLWPAAYGASGYNTSMPLYGSRFRVKANADITTGWTANNTKTLQALKTYGGFFTIRGGTGGGPRILAEDGAVSATDISNFITKTQYNNWIQNNLEIVNETSLMISPTSYAANVTIPTAHFKADVYGTSGTYGSGESYEGITIGGGATYPDIKTTGDHVVTTLTDLINHMDGGANEAQSGDVIFIPSGNTFMLTPSQNLIIPAGVTLASDRGYDGHTGALIIKNASTGGWVGHLIEAGGNNVRVTGLQLEGENYPQDGGGGDDGQGSGATYPNGSPITGPGAAYYLKGIDSQNGKSGIIVDNNELRGFAYASVYIEGDPNGVVKYNYIHHNQARSEGYGVDIDGGNAKIFGNLFDYNRHDITGDGESGEKYEFAFNKILGHGYAIGASHIDVHENPDSLPYAGRRFLVHHNTVVNTGGTNQPSFIHVRDIPQVGFYAWNNNIGTDWGGTWVSTSSGLTQSNYGGEKSVIRQTCAASNQYGGITLENNLWRGVVIPNNTGIIWEQYHGSSVHTHITEDPYTDYVPHSISGNAPMIINFSSLSYNSPTGFEWRITNVTGDNTPHVIGSTRNLSYNFTVGGNYSLKLNASNQIGYDISTVTMFVNVTGGEEAPPGPTAEFSATPVYGGGLPVIMFTDLSTGDPFDYEWYSRGDDSDWVLFSIQKNPWGYFGYHINGTPRDYDFMLNVSNQYGSSSTVKLDYITIHAPDVASIFTTDKTYIRFPGYVTFTDTSTGNASGHQWDFNDGTANSFTRNTTHQFTRPGIFNISLMVSNSSSNSTSYSYSQIWVTRKGIQRFYPGESNDELMVSFDDQTYTSSRDLTHLEQLSVMCKVMKLCEARYDGR